MKPVRATAHSNIALIKYWGKREGQASGLNLPAVSSLSLTLDALYTQTSLEPAAKDTFVLNDALHHDAMATKVFAHLDRVFAATGKPGMRAPCLVTSHNHVPTAAGLASSASGFAALTLAAAHSFGLDWNAVQLSGLARMGSGSASRSLFGGFVRWNRGHASDGSDSLAHPLYPPEHWDLRLVVAHAATGAKSVGSTEGMARSAQTSPYYRAWVEGAEQAVENASHAIAARDIRALGPLVEQSTMQMHACMLASWPPLLYWNDATVRAIAHVHACRARGLQGFITIDAGPHVKVLCLAADAPAWAKTMQTVEGIHAITTCAPGPDAHCEALA